MSQKIGLVLDINVYIDGFADNNASSRACFDLILKRPDFILVTSEYIIEKTDEVFKQRLGYNQVLLDEVFQEYNTLLDDLEAQDRLDYSPTHAFESEARTIYNLGLDDSHIYKLAFRNKPSIIITRDENDFGELKRTKPDRGVFIYSPKEFIYQFQARTKKPPTKPSPGLQFGMNPLNFQPGQGGLGRQI